MPALRKLPQVLIGHIFDATARIRAGVDYVNGVDVPFHKTLEEVFGEEKLRELKKRPNYPPDAVYPYEFISPQNFAYTESPVHNATMYKIRERDSSAPNQLWARWRSHSDYKDRAAPTPKFT